MQSSKCNDFFEKIKLSLMFAYVFLTNELNYEFGWYASIASKFGWYASKVNI